MKAQGQFPLPVVERWCAVCATRVRAMTATEAISRARIAADTIERGIAAGNVHYVFVSDALKQLCFRSLYHYALGEFILGEIEVTPLAPENFYRAGKNRIQPQDAPPDSDQDCM